MKRRFVSKGQATATIAKTDIKVSCNDGSKRSAGLFISRIRVAAPNPFSAEACRNKTLPSATKVNINAALITEA